MILVNCAGIVEKNATPKDNLIIENLNSEIILGDKIENLFTVEAVQSRAAEGTKVEANYMYFRCRSNDEEKVKWLWQRIKKFIQKYIANRPQGKISVYDTTTKSYSPVKNVLVMSHQLGIFGTSFTDSNGRFNIPLPYTSLGGKVQMIIRFENPNITLTSTEAVSSIFGAVTYYAGSYWIESLSNLDIKFGQNSLNAEFATIMNAMADYRTFCLENHITAPLPLKVFATKYVSGACTPLELGHKNILIWQAAGLKQWLTAKIR